MVSKELLSEDQVSNKNKSDGKVTRVMSFLLELLLFDISIFRKHTWIRYKKNRISMFFGLILRLCYYFKHRPISWVTNSRDHFGAITNFRI
jgi:hypothetical protein